MLEATVQVVLEKFASHAIREVGGFLKFPQDLDNMKNTLQKIKAYLNDAEKQLEIDNTNDVLKFWIVDLRRVTYEADDLLDELHYHWLRREVESHTKVRKILYSGRTKYKYSHRIRKIQETLDDILASAVNYNLIKLTALWGNLETTDEITQGRVTTSLMGDEKVIGRDDKKTEVIEQLMSEHEGVQVLTIYGIGGVGKTTLARYVYNAEVIQKHFELTIWVCVSDNFDVKMLTSEILDSVVIQSKKSNIRRSSEYISLDELQKALREELTGKKFLLVLDDVWNEEQQKWDEFKKTFVTTMGISKSKILVTTRSREIVEMMSSMKPIQLEGLSRDDFWNLFKRYVFDGSNSGRNQETLEKIGEEIVDKLKGSPLAAKTVGCLLKSNMSVKHWNNILNSELWKLSKGKEDIMQALRLSYQHLPGALKPCFAFLSLFPKNYEYKERMLKELWIANGFIFPQGTKSLEDTATTSINTLLSMCMIQVVKCEDMYWGPFDLPEREFVMHDLLHDLAQIISKEEYFHIRGDEDLKNIPDNVRQLNISSEITSSKLNNFKSTFKNLRTLVVSDSSNSSSCFNNKGLHGICIEAKHLRALMMRGMRFTEPLSKWHIKHLQYLDLSYTDISYLPESLCTLYNLQVLNIEGCDELNKFPVEIIKLVNLRHIYTSGANVSTSLIKNVGKLALLQELCFHVSTGVSHTMTELENMKEIRELEIEYLDNVSSKEEAIRARLNEKTHLVSLTLRWSWNKIDNVASEEILCGLQPYKYLRILQIYNYGGAEFPPWEENENKSLPTLQKFVLIRCLNLHTLKSLEHPELQYLEISDCPKLKKISVCKAPKLSWLIMSSCKELSLGSGFEGLDSLESLEISNCLSLWNDTVTKTWILPSQLKSLKLNIVGPNPWIMSKSFENLSSSRRLELNGEALQHMTSLEQLNISGLNKIKSLSCILPPSLHQLEFNCCSHLESLPESNQLPSLRYLQIWDCPKIKSLPTNGLPHSLRELKFFHCSNLESLSGNLDHLPSLEILFLEDCPKIKSLPANGLPPSLKELRFCFCSNLKSLPEILNHLPSLKTLYLQDCPKIKSFPANGLPPSLVQLMIYYCPLLNESCQKDIGSDWPKISNIPSVRIDGEVVING